MDDRTIKKSLRYSIYDGMSFAVMEGFTSTFLTPFAIALNASVSMIAALTYMPYLIGSFIHLFAAKIVEIVRDRRMILVVCSFLHAVLWIPLLLLPYISPEKKYLIVAYVSIQTILANLMSPVWNSLMGDLVPKNERGRYFGFRDRIVGITSFIATLVAGLILYYFSPKSPFVGFAILFSIAFAARVLSGIFKAVIHNPSYDTSGAERFSIIDFVIKMNKTNYGRFVIYLAFFKFAVNIASPFFAVYLLNDLKLGYLQFTLLIAAEMIASFLALGMWGKLIDNKGTKSVLYITGMFTPLVPLLWLFSQNIYILLLIQIFSGAAWAGFNLSASNFMFDSVKPENRVRCIAYFKFFEGLAVFAGAVLGGILIKHLPSWVFISSIPFVFLVSGILRLAISLIMLPTLREARLIELGLGHTFFKSHLFIRPTEGFVYEVIGKYDKGEEDMLKNKLKPKLKKEPKKEADANDSYYTKKLLKFISRDAFKKKEQRSMEDMREIEKITEEIKKGKNK